MNSMLFIQKDLTMYFSKFNSTRCPASAFGTYVLVFILLTGFSRPSSAQGFLEGKVMERHQHRDHVHLSPLAGANLVWLGTTQGTATDANGAFRLAKPSRLPHKLVVSFIGFVSDTLEITEAHRTIEVTLTASAELDEVTVAGRRPGTHVSTLEPILTQVITSSELQRAACCNLSEAFETNASIDVSYSDAVSGAQQIQMLGLAGIYSQIMTENMPTIRGLGQPFGLGFIPGPWMESIQISKGAASVINGYESITGQINVELKKPENDERFYYNFYANDFGRFESTINAAVDLSPLWRTMIMAHGEVMNNMIDHTHNAFLDHPMMKKYNIINRYRYDRPGVMESQFGFRVLQEEREGGQLAFYENGENWGSDRYYGFGVNTSRYEVFAKTGFFFRRLPDASVGTQLNFTHHNQESFYGKRPYDGTQNSFYANILFENSLGHPDHRFTTGVSYMLDDYAENLSDSLFARKESVPGTFFQYTYMLPEKLTLSGGVRLDFHNLYGTFFTPRFHIRYSLDEHTIFRASAGKGYRVPNLVAENTGLLVSSRRLAVLEEILPEEAWNYGGSLTRHMTLFRNDASVSAEIYRTHFINQLIVDIETDYRVARFYNLNGQSFANNYQLEFNFEPARMFEVTAALRYSDVKTTINDELVVKPFVNKYRGILSGSYATRSNRWQFDATAQFNGPGRIPVIRNHTDAFHFPEKSPAHTLMLAQVTYRWRNLDLYIGGENLTNFRQEHPIIDPGNPFGEHFDASMIWGPVTGRMIYMGLRFSIERG
jgi:outer membrane receptor for ferrienterochelin and colicins